MPDQGPPFYVTTRIAAGRACHYVDQRADNGGPGRYSLRGLQTFETPVRTYCGLVGPFRPDTRGMPDCRRCIRRQAPHPLEPFARE